MPKTTKPAISVVGGSGAPDDYRVVRARTEHVCDHRRARGFGENGRLTVACPGAIPVGAFYLRTKLTWDCETTLHLDCAVAAELVTVT